MPVKKVVFAIVFVFQSGLALAQDIKTLPITKSSAQGTWRLEQYAQGILKVAFTPAGLAAAEQVSNAVILKALLPSPPAMEIKMTVGNKGLSFHLNPTELNLLGYFDSAGHKGFRFELENGERIFGTGERSVPLNRRGYKLLLYNNPAYGYSTNAESLNYSVPFIQSSKGYAIFFDNPAKGYLDIGKTSADVLEYGASSGKLEFFVIPGKNADEMLRKYHSLTGTQPIPARWVFGNLMSRFGYTSEQQLMSTVKQMQDDQFPVDAVILDLFWFGDSIKGTLGNLDWTNKVAWPHPANMISVLKKKSIQTILITEPFVLKGTPNYEPSKSLHATDSVGNPYLLTNFYFGDGGLLDIFRTKTQDWFWSKYKKQINIGVAGWWGDLGEPETHPENMYHNLRDFGFNRRFKANEVHNIYGHVWDKMLFEKYAKEYPETRLFNLNRSGYAGSPRYAVFPWSGDVSRSWEGLQAQLPLMIGMSLSGVPYIHADAGGFAGGEGDNELYIRWLQFATFTPVFRPHGTALGNIDTSVKNIPSEATFYDEPYKSNARKTMQLRYKLLPYNYSLAYEQARFGKPLVRPLFYYNNQDSNYFKTDNQYMWGDALLVAPVLKPALKSLDVYLPAGDWYQMFTDEKHNGGKWITEKLTPENIPIFVRAGSFIPTFESGESVKNTAQYNGKEIYVTYYPSASNATYTLYDDDGRSKSALQKGNYELIRFDGVQKNKQIFITVKPGSKSSMRRSRQLYFALPQGFNMASATVDGRPQKMDEKKIKVNYSGMPVNVVLTLR